MEQFLNKITENNKYELLIDNNLFSKDIIMKTAFLFLDKWYFFLKKKEDNTFIVQFTLKEWSESSLETLIWDFSNELLNNSLREKLFEDNKEIRNEIITTALQNSLREAELPNAWKWYEENNEGYFPSNQDNQPNQIDFDKDIDDILSEIENDPDLKIDESEIENILKEIEEESKIESEKSEITVDLNAIADVKKQFKK